MCQEARNLGHLSDEALAAVVEDAVEEHGSDRTRWPFEANAALRELATRSNAEA